MDKHGDREHATWSASATERNWNCPGALALTMNLPESTSEAADWGTCCHQIAEVCLREGRDAVEWIGQTVKGKKHSFECDDEMAETTQVYVDYVRGRLAEYEAATGDKAMLLIEQKFSLADLDTPFDAGGTGDAVLYFPLWKLLEIVDLKGGRGVRVAADENKQTRTYGLGAMLANAGLVVERIKATIIQPRTDRQPKSEEFHVADLVDWTGDLLAAMKRSRVALDASPKHMLDVRDETDEDTGKPFKSVSTMVPAAWATEHLKPGPWCSKTFCKAQGFCPALQQKALDAAGVWFDDLDQPRLANSPDAMSPEALAQALDAADMIEGWINAVRAYAHAQAEMGVTIPEYMLVDRIGRRKWKDEDGAEAKLKALVDDPYTKKLVSPAQAEKLLGKKRAGEIADLIEKPITGTNLVRADKTTRPAVQPAVEKHFSILD